MVEVAEKFNVCLTYFKRRCRSLGIRRWPYRKIQSMLKREEKSGLVAKYKGEDDGGGGIPYDVRLKQLASSGGWNEACAPESSFYVGDYTSQPNVPNPMGYNPYQTYLMTQHMIAQHTQQGGMFGGMMMPNGMMAPPGGGGMMMPPPGTLGQGDMLQKMPYVHDGPQVCKPEKRPREEASKGAPSAIDVLAMAAAAHNDPEEEVEGGEEAPAKKHKAEVKQEEVQQEAGAATSNLQEEGGETKVAALKELVGQEREKGKQHMANYIQNAISLQKTEPTPEEPSFKQGMTPQDDAHRAQYVFNLGLMMGQMAHSMGKPPAAPYPHNMAPPMNPGAGVSPQLRYTEYYPA